MNERKNFFGNLFGRKPAAEENSAPATAPAIVPSTDGSSAPAIEETPEKPAKQGFFQRLADGLQKSSQRLADGVAAIFTKKKLDAATLEELEELLIAADLGTATAAKVAAALAKDRFDKEVTDGEVKTALAEVVAETMKDREAPLRIEAARRPHVILVVGVNGAGKTTTIGKLAARFRSDGFKVMLAAGDTFRAAAVEQLIAWGQRAGASVVAREQGADSAGLAFEALERARAEAADVLLIDTAGRLQNKRELMDELAKVVRVIRKLDPAAPHDTLLVLDATVGQNALSQADVFREIAGVTGLVMTKLDGTARGGVLVALGERHKLPIHFIGVGEGVADLQPFEAKGFARALAGLQRL
jgi:fused signal recognition particle receptor